MFESIKKYWNNHGFEIVIIGSFVFIAILAITRIGKKGTWSSSYFRPDQYIKKQGPPKESSGERECRRVLQKIFNKPFNKCRPNFLSNPVTGDRFNLELDCYEHSLKLAIEYNGIQHYKYVPYFHKNKEAFLNQKYRDDMKRRMCKDNNITLIEVPNTVDISNIESYIIDKLKMSNHIK